MYASPDLICTAVLSAEESLQVSYPEIFSVLHLLESSHALKLVFIAQFEATNRAMKLNSIPIKIPSQVVDYLKTKPRSSPRERLVVCNLWE